MLLPSDVARLVLGYLQEEGLSATSQAFIHESPDLKEYAEHSSADGTIPACVFSIFGKGLTTILNEYMATRTKEACHEVPVMMTSLWKKLDFTLNQIKSMQNSPATSACQRTRTRVGLANMARQRVLTVSSASAVVCSTMSEPSSVFSPAHTSHVILSHSTPVSYSAQHLRQFPCSGTPQQIQDGSRLQNTPRDSPISIVVSENRLNSGPMSPGRRKWDLPRRRGGAQCGSSGPGRSATAPGGTNAEPQPEEVVDGNFPQLVIQNARDRILGNRILQEKLAENINKILANEPTPQTSKASSATVETDQSIDEILGLQGEIHMSDDAIHDILEQTESDPAFQALFDLFDYNKTKDPEGEAGYGDVSSTPEVSDGVGSPSTFHSDDPGSSQRDTDLSDTNLASVKAKAGQARKTRRPGASTMLKKTLLAPSGRTSRIEGSTARLLTPGVQRVGSSTARVSNNADVQQMDIDEPLHTPPPPADCMDSSEPPAKDCTTSTSSGLCELVPLSRASAVTTTTSSNVDKAVEQKGQPTLSSLAWSDEPFIVEQSLVSTVDLSAIAVPSNGGGSQTLTVPPLVTAQSVSSTSTAAPSTATLTGMPDSLVCSSASTTLTALTMASSTHLSPTSSCSAQAPAPSSASVSLPNMAAADSSNVVSLKIIISDNPEEESSKDTALNQAISSISGEKLPTIYISSPAKSPSCSGLQNVPGTPKNNLDEVAQAVCGLQSSEALASPLAAKAGPLLASPLTGTSQGPQGYIIQVPLDSTNAALQGAPASYFLVTESPKRDPQPRQVLLPANVPKAQPTSINQFGAPTSTHPQCFPTGSTLILPSTVKPVVLPFSVVGQNSLGSVHMVANQIVSLASSVSAQQPETVKPKSSSVSSKPSQTAVENAAAGKDVLPVSSGKTNHLDATKGPSHRRILCFDSSKAVQLQTAGTTQTTTPAVTQQPGKAKVPPGPRSKAAILSGNKPKRRIETVRCTTDSKAAEVLEKSAGPPQVHKEPVKKNSRKQDHNTQKVCTGQVESSQPPTSKKLESKTGSKPVDRKSRHDQDQGKSSDSQTSSRSNDNAQKSGAAVEKEESTRNEPAEKAPAKSREGRTEKRTPSQEMPHVTANKENEIKGSTQEQSTSASSALRDFSPPVAPQPTSNPEPRTPSKTSSLVKQAAEMLQDIQGLNSPSSVAKKPGAGSSELNLPRTPGTGRSLEQPANSPRTPSRHRKCKGGEGTPKRLIPPNTPDVPTCSPASEAGSENSINMAAHTLMILSRAAIARTGTPLKDSLRQDGAEEKTPTGSKSSKKRKLTSPTASPPAKKESKPSPSSKKKDRERKKLVDCFPHDLDVDKFLSSLHYDE